MKTTISLPDNVYKRAKRAAKRLRKSRSELYAEAVAEYIAHHDPDEVTEAMDRVCEAVDSRHDPALAQVAQRVLQRTQWKVVAGRCCS